MVKKAAVRLPADAARRKGILAAPPGRAYAGCRVRIAFGSTAGTRGIAGRHMDCCLPPGPSPCSIGQPPNAVMPAKSPAKKKKPAKAEKKPAKTEAIVAKAKLKKQPFWIGFDLGGTKMLACVLDADYQVLATARKTTNGSDGQVRGRKKILNAIHEAIAESGLDPAGLQGIGIGCPGLVNAEKGILINAPNLGWHNMGLAGILKTAFKVPVVVLNDVDAGTYGEYQLGAGKGARSLLGVFPGTGLGAGFVYDGRIVMGRNVSAMELGMIYLPGTHLGSPRVRHGHPRGPHQPPRPGLPGRRRLLPRPAA
jgi:hypothetical protein